MLKMYNLLIRWAIHTDLYLEIILFRTHVDDVDGDDGDDDTRVGYFETNWLGWPFTNSCREYSVWDTHG